VNTSGVGSKFTREVLDKLLPAEKSDRFFEALLGDAEEGAYDIGLEFNGVGDGKLEFAFQLKKRPDKCLVCSLTYGLPNVFMRHPVIDAKGIVSQIETLVGPDLTCTGWSLGKTREISPDLHVIPLSIDVKGGGSL
jgi:hypothetical protein